MKTFPNYFPVFTTDSGLAGDKHVSKPATIILPGLSDQGKSLSTDYLILPEEQIASPARRLVVLVPENEINENELARRLWQLASTHSLAILLIALSSSQDTDAYLRRRLASLTAVIGDVQVSVNSRFSMESSWTRAVENIYQPGDLLVCFEKHFELSWGIRRRELGLELSKSLNAPVYILTGLQYSSSLRWQKLKREIVTWTCSIALMIAFFWIQIQIDQSMEGWTSKILLFLTILVEVALLLNLNDRTG